MITVIISEADGWREWKHRARTKDAQTAIIRAMNKHFPRSYNFIPDDIDNLVDGLWFELKTVDLDGEENTYHLQLEVIEITRANDNSPSAY